MHVHPEHRKKGPDVFVLDDEDGDGIATRLDDDGTAGPLHQTSQGSNAELWGSTTQGNSARAGKPKATQALPNQTEDLGLEELDLRMDALEAPEPTTIKEPTLEDKIADLEKAMGIEEDDDDPFKA